MSALLLRGRRRQTVQSGLTASLALAHTGPEPSLWRSATFNATAATQPTRRKKYDGYLRCVSQDCPGRRLELAHSFQWLDALSLRFFLTRRNFPSSRFLSVHPFSVISSFAHKTKKIVYACVALDPPGRAFGEMAHFELRNERVN